MRKSVAETTDTVPRSFRQLCLEFMDTQERAWFEGRVTGNIQAQELHTPTTGPW